MSDNKITCKCANFKFIDKYQTLNLDYFANVQF